MSFMLTDFSSFKQTGELRMKLHQSINIIVLIEYAAGSHGLILSNDTKDDYIFRLNSSCFKNIKTCLMHNLIIFFCYTTTFY